jgi:hypothetical protein
MGAGWVAGVTRARALRTRALGAERLRDVAATGTLDDALRGLRTTEYGRDVTPDASTADAQRAVSAALLWHLRVLAGWQPRQGAQAVRTLAAGFEISNVQEHLRSLTGPPLPGPPRAPYRLGALATAWPRLSRARTPGEVRALLAASAWGDPGEESAAAVAVGMRVSAAVHVADSVAEASRWAAGRLALVVARCSFAGGRPLPEASARRAVRLLGHGSVRSAVAGGSFADYGQALPAAARWALDGVTDVSDLWWAEARWWEVVDQDGHDLLRRSGFGPGPVAGAVAVLSADAWRARAALELAERGGGSLDVLEAGDGQG